MFHRDAAEEKSEMFTISGKGMIVVAVVIALLILVSIQFTLNMILREVREIRKKMDLRESEEVYGRRNRDE